MRIARRTGIGLRASYAPFGLRFENIQAAATPIGSPGLDRLFPMIISQRAEKNVSVLLGICAAAAGFGRRRQNSSKNSIPDGTLPLSFRVRKQYRIGNSLAIVYAGRIVPRKGIPVLIKATNMVRQTFVNIYCNFLSRDQKGDLYFVRADSMVPNNILQYVHFFPRRTHRSSWPAGCLSCFRIS